VSAHVADLQREIAAEGVLNAEIPSPNVGCAEVGVHGPDAARGCGCAREHRARRKYNAVPIEPVAGDQGGAGRDSATVGLRTRAPHGYCRLAGARRHCGDAGSPDVRDPGISGERGHAEHGVEHARASPHDCRPFARDIPGQAQARRKVLVVGMPEIIAHTRLAQLNQSQRRIKVAQQVVGLLEGRRV